MVLLSTISTKINRFIAPKLLKASLTIRYTLSLDKPIIHDNPYLDAFFLIPLTQKLVSIEVQQLAKEQEEQERNGGGGGGGTSTKESSAVDDFVDRVWDKYLDRMSPQLQQDLSQQEQQQDQSQQEQQNISPRLKAFTKYMRPVLTPNNTFQDINRWRFHNRFIKWLRSEYLICKYESQIRTILSNTPKLKQSSLLRTARNKVRDTLRYGVLSTVSYASSGRNDDGVILDDNNNGSTSLQFAKRLPSVRTLNDAFDMHHWDKTKKTYTSSSSAATTSATTLISTEYDQMAHITTHKLNGTIIQVPGTNIQIPEVNIDTNVQSLTLEEILEVAGCHVSSCNAFNALCDDAGIYEFWTEEYVTGLSHYLMERCQSLTTASASTSSTDDSSASDSDGDGDASTKDVVIVDVGAGDGTLAHFLRENMVTNRISRGGLSMNKKREKNNKKKDLGGRGNARKRENGRNNNNDNNNNMNSNSNNNSKKTSNKNMSIPTIVATDNGSYRIKPKANVEQLSITETMKKYSPYGTNDISTDIDVDVDVDVTTKRHHLIVICSWMPMGEDWTKLFRDAGVDEYILIGECDDGNCGHNWYTWGNKEFCDSEDVDNDAEDGGGGEYRRHLIPDYILDEYQRNELEDLTKLQFSRFDSAVSSGSKTISFKRRV